MATSTPKVKTPPPWATDPTTRLVACIDGPLRDQWFFAHEWEERVAGAQHMASLDQPRSPCLEYVADGTTVTHPEWPELAQGAAMHHRPGRRTA